MEDFFEWDPKKSEANQRKHGLSFEQASVAFGDPFMISFPDGLHSDEEERFVSLGSSGALGILVIVHTDRGEAVRIISARRALPREVAYYERENKLR